MGDTGEMPLQAKENEMDQSCEYSNNLQTRMIAMNWPGNETLYTLCTCGFRLLDEGTDYMAEEFHNEICERRTSWQWISMPASAVVPDEFNGMFKFPVHYYYAMPGQTSLRCSFCADAPTSPLHKNCSATWPVSYVEEGLGEPNMNSSQTRCFELAMSSSEEYCEHHWLDLK